MKRVEAISENAGVCSVVFGKIQCGEYGHQYGFEYVLVACASICKFIIMCWLLIVVGSWLSSTMPSFSWLLGDLGGGALHFIYGDVFMDYVCRGHDLCECREFSCSFWEASRQYIPRWGYTTIMCAIKVRHGPKSKLAKTNYTLPYNFCQ